MEFDRSGFDRLEASGKALTQAVMDSKGAAVLEDDVAKRTKCMPFFEPEHFQRHITDEPCCHRPREIGKVGLGHLVIERLVNNRGPKEGVETAVEIGQGLYSLVLSTC